MIVHAGGRSVTLILELLNKHSCYLSIAIHFIATSTRTRQAGPHGDL